MTSQFDVENYVKPKLLDKFKKQCMINSKDFYSCGVIATAHLIMLNLMRHKTDGKIFKQDKMTPKQAHDNAFEQHQGHSGASACAAISMAIHFSPRGEELRKWWNKQHGVSEDKKGVVQPHIMTIGGKNS